MTLRNKTRRRLGAFTMIELMLVVAIIGIASAVAIPSFVSSFKGVKLRSAARTVAMASRFARSTAVLHQKDVALIFYSDRNELEMVTLHEGVGKRERERFLDSREARAVAGLLDDATSVPNVSPVSIVSELVRALPEGVKVLNVEVNGEIVEIEGSYLVNFFRNGMSDPFSLRLADEANRVAEVVIDPLSGRVKITYGG